jgi:hypothetical protein
MGMMRGFVVCQEKMKIFYVRRRYAIILPSLWQRVAAGAVGKEKDHHPFLDDGLRGVWGEICKTIRELPWL